MCFKLTANVSALDLVHLKFSMCPFLGKQTRQIQNFQQQRTLICLSLIENCSSQSVKSLSVLFGGNRVGENCALPGRSENPSWLKACEFILSFSGDIYKLYTSEKLTTFVVE